MLPPEVVPAHLGRLTRGKLNGLEVIVDAIEANEGLSRMGEMNSAFAGGKGAKKHAEYLERRAKRLEAVREREEGVPLGQALAEAVAPRFSSFEDVKAFAAGRRAAEGGG